MANNSEVAHAWAHGLEKAYKGSNLYHCNGKLKSYNTCIGQKITVNGKDIYILDTYYYSITTCKHQRLMNDAIPVDAVCFRVNYGDYCGWKLIDPSDDGMVKFGVKYIEDSYIEFSHIYNLNTISNNLNKDLYNEAVRWFQETRCSSISKILKMKNAELERYVTKGIDITNFRKFIKAMNENRSIGDIVDMVNGKGAWEKYLERIKSQLRRQYDRTLTTYVGYKTARYIQPRSIYKKYQPVAEGSITNAIRKKHLAAGDWMQFLLRERKKNIAAAIKRGEFIEKMGNREMATRRLEMHCGMSLYPRRIVNYNGVMVDLRDEKYHGIRPVYISEDEYKDFIALSKEEKSEWVRQKKDWMLNYLTEESEKIQKRIAAQNAKKEKEEKARERYFQYIAENQERIAELSKQGFEGMDILWHDCLINDYSLYKVPSEYFHGGNVWLRVNPFTNVVESSKGIRIPIEECKRLWAIVNRWHKNSSEFVSGEKVDATMNRFIITRYQRDIMIAGCHAIAYSEMKNVAEKLGFEI